MLIMRHSLVGNLKKYLKNLLLKVSFQKHNELLSVYDDEAIKFERSIEYAMALSLERRNSR